MVLCNWTNSATQPGCLSCHAWPEPGFFQNFLLLSFTFIDEKTAYRFEDPLADHSQHYFSGLIE